MDARPNVCLLFDTTLPVRALRTSVTNLKKLCWCHPSCMWPNRTPSVQEKFLPTDYRPTFFGNKPEMPVEASIEGLTNKLSKVWLIGARMCSNTLEYARRPHTLLLRFYQSTHQTPITVSGQCPQPQESSSREGCTCQQSCLCQRAAAESSIDTKNIQPIILYI